MQILRRIRVTFPAEDAKRAVDCGVAGIVVSNHGGRVMNGLPATVREGKILGYAQVVVKSETM